MRVTRAEVLGGLLALLVCGAVFGYELEGRRKGSACTETAVEKCPSAEWLADWDKYDSWQKKWTPPKDERDQMTGMLNRLSKEGPGQGWAFDPRKRKFVPEQEHHPVVVPQVK